LLYFCLPELAFDLLYFFANCELAANSICLDKNIKADYKKQIGAEDSNAKAK